MCGLEEGLAARKPMSCWVYPTTLS